MSPGEIVVRRAAPLESTSSDALVDMRQTRWERGGSRADPKCVTGVVAVVYHPWPRP